MFENDLPEYEHFMKARATKPFRRRKRWELRLQQRASNTLRKYRFCEEDEWSKDEADAAASLLLALERLAERRRDALRVVWSMLILGCGWIGSLAMKICCALRVESLK